MFRRVRDRTDSRNWRAECRDNACYIYCFQRGVCERPSDCFGIYSQAQFYIRTIWLYKHDERERERIERFFVVSLAIKTTGSNLPAISGDLFVLIENLQASSGPTNNLNKWDCYGTFWAPIISRSCCSLRHTIVWYGSINVVNRLIYKLS